MRWRRARTFRDAPRQVTPICPATDCASRAMATATSALNTGRVWTVLRRARRERVSVPNAKWPTVAMAEGGGRKDRGEADGADPPLKFFSEALRHQGRGAAEPVTEAELGGLNPRRVDDDGRHWVRVARGGSRDGGSSARPGPSWAEVASSSLVPFGVEWTAAREKKSPPGDTPPILGKSFSYQSYHSPKNVS